MMKISKRTLFFRIGAVVLLLVIAALMMVIGRGHTVYIDNKTFEYEGQTYEAVHKVTCYKGGEKFAKLAKRERGMVDVIGQKLKIDLEVIKEKGGAEEAMTLVIKLPYNQDGLILNLPAYLAGLPEDAYLDEFIPAAPAEEETEETVDEFGLGGMEG